MQSSQSISKETLHILTTISNAFYALDKDWKFIYVNAQVEKLMHRSSAELIGRNIWKIFPDSTGKPIFNYFHKAMETGEPVRFEEFNNAESTWFEIYAYPSDNGLAVYVNNITAHKKQEEEKLRLARSLKEHELNLQDFLENAPVPIHWVDARGIIIYANKAELSMLGYSAGEYIGKNISDFHADQTAIRDILNRLWNKDELESYEATLLCKDGSIKYAAISSNVVWKDGEFIHTRCFTRDITQRKQYEQMLYFLNKAGKELSEGLDYKKAFRNITRLIVPALADWFLIDALDDKGSIETLTLGHKDPEKVRWGLNLRKQYPPDMNASVGVPNVLRTGRSEMYPLIPDEMLVAAAKDEEHLKITRSLGFHSVMIVPLTANNKTFGAITFVTTQESRRTYTEADLRLAEDFAHQVAFTLENGSLYEKAQAELEEKIRIQHNLEEQRQQWELITNAVPALIAYVDNQRRYQYINQRYLDWFGGKEEDFIGKDVQTVIGPDIPLKDPYIRKVLSGKEVNFEAQVTYSDHKTRDIAATYIPDISREGDVRGYVSLIIDISERKRVERDLLAKHEALQMQSKVLESMSEGVSVSTEDGIILYTNPAEDNMFGYDPGELTGKHITVQSSYSPAESVRLINEITQTLDEKGTWTGEFNNVRKDGTRFITRASINGLGLSEKRYWVCVHEDITQEKNIRQSILESIERFRYLAESIPHLVWTAKPEGMFDYYNQNWVDYTGLSIDDSKETGWMAALHPDDLRKCIKSWEESIENTQGYEIECRLRRKDGRYRWYLNRAIPLKDAEGNIIKWFGTFTDINDQKTLNDKKDEFIGIASHELKTPLTSIKAYVQLLERIVEKGVDEPARLYVKKTGDYIERLNNLISDLLDVSKIQAGKLQFNMEEFAFDDLVNESVESMTYLSKKHSIHLKGSSGARVFGDKNRLEQVFMNYLSNAIKYSPNHDRIEVEVSRVHDDQVQVRITDYGIGIPKEKLPRLFDRFYRVESNNISGLGIGLYISSEILKRHKGKTWVESEEGKGSSFYFTLPVMD